MFFASTAPFCDLKRKIAERNPGSSDFSGDNTFAAMISFDQTTINLNVSSVILAEVLESEQKMVQSFPALRLPSNLALRHAAGIWRTWSWTIMLAAGAAESSHRSKNLFGLIRYATVAWLGVISDEALHQEPWLICGMGMTLEFDGLQVSPSVHLVRCTQLMVTDDLRIRDLLPPCLAQQVLRLHGRIAQEIGIGHHGHEFFGVHRVPSAEADLCIV